MQILVVRNDRLGDFMLAWPALRLLKEQMPEARLLALVPEYTGMMVELCPWIDEVVLDPGGSRWRDVRRLARRIRRADVDKAIALFSTGRVAAALALARVSYRLGPASKLAQLLLTHRLVQRRSRSEKPEFEYNADLAREFLQQHGKEQPDTPAGPFLTFPATDLEHHRRDMAEQLGLSAGDRWIFVHAGSGGSANNLRPTQYLDLCRAVAKPGRAFIFTAGPNEVDAAQTVADALATQVPTAMLSPGTLPALARSLAVADLFISGSTGPLHIAGALDRPTATFYPGHRSGSSLRWRTMNRAEIRLAFTPPEGGDPKDVSRCDIPRAADAIEALLGRL